jgi:hypothetical protein
MQWYLNMTNPPRKIDEFNDGDVMSCDAISHNTFYVTERNGSIHVQMMTQDLNEDRLDGGNWYDFIKSQNLLCTRMATGQTAPPEEARRLEVLIQYRDKMPADWLSDEDIKRMQEMVIAAGEENMILLDKLLSMKEASFPKLKGALYKNFSGSMTLLSLEYQKEGSELFQAAVFKCDDDGSLAGDTGMFICKNFKPVGEIW